MLNQSRILVWYQIASQRIELGEAMLSKGANLVSLWTGTPTELLDDTLSGYRIALFDDDGRMIAEKAISNTTADELLIGQVGLS